MRVAAATYLPAGDMAVVVQFGETVDPVINKNVRQFCSALAALKLGWIIEIIPTYRSALIYYDCMKVQWPEMLKTLEGVASSPPSTGPERNKVLVIPVQYGDDKGPDLSFVAQHSGLTEAEVIKIHTAPKYLVYMMGFSPGYAYMGGLDPRLFVPRLGTPRMSTPGGAVVMGGTQTGIHPTETPGGMRIIGRTPLRLFDPSKEQPFLVEAGIMVEFKPIDKDEFDRIDKAAVEGTFEPEVYYEPERV
jgi:KipI family sensor histidine kinase inhibitor